MHCPDSMLLQYFCAFLVLVDIAGGVVKEDSPDSIFHDSKMAKCYHVKGTRQGVVRDKIDCQSMM